jgi:hypothetical protein
MVTSKAVQQGAPLLAVPRSLLISADTARASPLCGPLLERSDLDDWQVGGCKCRDVMLFAAMPVCAGLASQLDAAGRMSPPPAPWNTFIRRHTASLPTIPSKTP